MSFHLSFSIVEELTYDATPLEIEYSIVNPTEHTAEDFFSPARMEIVPVGFDGVASEWAIVKLSISSARLLT